MNLAQFVRSIATIAGALALAGCSLLTPLPGPTDGESRLAAFPTDDLPLREDVTVRWNEHGVPFVEAETDEDLATALGLIHAHLRLAQMELLRRIVQGRLAEMAGPPASDIDHSLRILDIGYAAPEVVEAMPAETRAWAEAFVAGINHYVDRLEELPHEFTVLGLDREPWTVEDVIAIGRLASVDINWLRWFSLMPLRDRDDWPEIWARILRAGGASLPSYDPEAPDGLRRLSRLLGEHSKSGSNSFAVAPPRSATGGALIASDPHLGIHMPNLWLIAGMRSPSYEVVGLMVPGLPFAAIGRNAHVAWGGTNLMAASSDLVDVSGLDASRFSVERESVKVRWWFDREVTVRRSPFGPVVSDAPVFPDEGWDGPLAIRWIGHQATDELTALLGIMRATSFEEFRDALEPFAISGQVFVYADVEGDIGLVTATHLPSRPATAPPDMILPPEDGGDWSRILTAADLPAILNPPAGLIASANNPPAPASYRVSWFPGESDRIGRLNELLSSRDDWTMEALAEVQRDVFQHSTLHLRDAVLAKVDAAPAGSLGGLDAPARTALDALRDWDGHFEADSVGALVATVALAATAEAVLDQVDVRAGGAIGHQDSYLAAAIEEREPREVAAALGPALSKAAARVEEFGTWGGMHRLRLAHPLVNLPLVGGRYELTEMAVGGGETSIMKTAPVDRQGRHNVSYGANARHVSDLSDPDANWFVLLGGQDGWLGSSWFQDQVELWREGRYIQVPLTPEAVRRLHSRVQVLSAAS